MDTDLMRYDRLVEGALRGVMVEALRRVAESGLPGGHHFYITFRTDHPGVRLRADLKARHPEEMTIVLQRRFRDLRIGDAAFEVSLSFDSAWQTLVVPFDAVTAFADPSVKFGLQFRASEAAPAEAGKGAQVEPMDRGTAAAPAKRDKERAKRAEARAKRTKRAAKGAAEVIALDAFRKK